MVVMMVTLLLPAAVRPQHCSADCRAGARCCSEAQCADQPADGAQPQYQGGATDGHCRLQIWIVCDVVIAECGCMVPDLTQCVAPGTSLTIEVDMIELWL